MKSILLSVALFATIFVQKTNAQDSTKAQTSQLLTTYYNLKDALVGSNANAAATAAEDFVKAVNVTDKETVKDETRSALLKDANDIAQSKDLNTQRQKFANLSTTMYALAKTVKLSPDPIYQQYCPMKKASWLSSNKAIKNPYYGSAMLTCGSVKETL
jgi:hypothetical protein